MLSLNLTNDRLELEKFITIVLEAILNMYPNNGVYFLSKEFPFIKNILDNKNTFTITEPVIIVPKRNIQNVNPNPSISLKEILDKIPGKGIKMNLNKIDADNLLSELKNFKNLNGNQLNFDDKKLLEKAIKKVDDYIKRTL